MGLIFYNWIGILVYAIIGAVIAAFDYPDRSIQIYLNRGVPRSTLLSARLVSILFFGLLLSGFTLAALLGLGYLSRLVYFGGRLGQPQRSSPAVSPAAPFSGAAYLTSP